MGVMATAATRSRGLDRAWRLLAAAMLLAFGFQSYLAQTHIHETVAATSAMLIHQPGHNKSPMENSPLDCPFCQVVTHAGNFLLSDASLLLLPSQWMETAALHHVLPDTHTAANHYWQSRAPPSH